MKKSLKNSTVPSFLSFGINMGDKIKLDTIINDYSNGGLKMIDIQETCRNSVTKNAVYERFF